MKRYVKELAHDILSRVEPVEQRKRIEKAVSDCERGYALDHETARKIIDVLYGD